jgi:type II secretory pathway pseudopilin PulG
MTGPDNTLRPRGAPPRRAADGFTLVEVMVAVLIIMVGAIALAGVLTRTVAAVSLSRQSQQASNLAASTLAEVEAMPWTTGSGLPNSGDANYGLSSTDVSSDSNLASDGSGGYCFEGMHVVVQGVAGTGACSSTWQWANVKPLQSCQNSLVLLPSVIAGTAPLSPHLTCVLVNGTEFNIGMYPSQVISGGAGVSVNLEVEFTAVVTWDGSGTSLDGADTRVSDTVIVCGAPSGSHTRTC